MMRLRSVLLTPPMSRRAESPESSTEVGPPLTRERKSGAMAMNPSAATWSATPRTQVESPKISCTTTTTGAFCRVEGYTTHAISESAEPGSSAILTHSPWRGLAESRAGADRLLGGRPGVPCRRVSPAVTPAAGAATSAALMCAMWSSGNGPGRGVRWSVQAARRRRVPGTRWRGMDTFPRRICGRRASRGRNSRTVTSTAPDRRGLGPRCCGPGPGSWSSTRAGLHVREPPHCGAGRVHSRLQLQVGVLPEIHQGAVVPGGLQRVALAFIEGAKALVDVRQCTCIEGLPAPLWQRQHLLVHCDRRIGLAGRIERTPQVPRQADPAPVGRTVRRPVRAAAFRLRLGILVLCEQDLAGRGMNRGVVQTALHGVADFPILVQQG